MRIEALTLEKYGAISQRSIAFDGAGLTVVYGANEAGKSTCLAAIGDFLFRIPERSPRTSNFGTADVRIGARLRTANGQVLNYKRRAGRNLTLIDGAGAPCDDALLAPLLTTTTRERFEQLFGLNNETLRDGGEQLLRADGEIGRLIVEAGGGLRSLVKRLDTVEEELARLFKPGGRAASLAFVKALTGYTTADQAAKAGLLSREAYERDRAACTTADATLQNLRAEKLELGERLSRLQRAERVVPTLRSIEQAEAEMAEHVEMAALPLDFADRCDRALKDRAAAAVQLDAAKSSRDALAERVDGFSFDERLIEFEAVIREIGARANQVAGFAEGRANRANELLASEAELAVLRSRLQLGPEDDLEPRLPPETALDAVRLLANEAIERRPKLETAREAQSDAEAALAGARDRIRALAERGRHEPLGFETSAFANLAAEHAAAQTKAAQARTALEGGQSRARALGFADPEALRTLPCPTEDQVRVEATAREAIRAARTEQIAVKALNEAVRDTASLDIARLREAGEVATDEAVTAARARREQAWTPIRVAHHDGRPNPSDAVRVEEISALEAATTAADRISDSRTHEAQRVASLVEAQRRLDQAQSTLSAADAGECRLTEVMNERAAAFAAAFPEACRVRPELPALLVFLREREEVLTGLAAAEELERAAGLELSRLAPYLRRLDLAEIRAGLAPTEAEDLPARLAKVASAISEHDRGHAEHQRESRDAVGLETVLGKARRRREELETAHSDWKAAWSEALALIGLGPEASPEDGAALATRWTGSRGELRSIAHINQRLRRMNEDEAGLAELVRSTAASLGLALPDAPKAAAEMLGERWRAADATRTAKNALLPELKGLDKGLTVAEKALSTAEEVLGALACEAGLQASNPDQLGAVARRHRAYAALVARRNAQIITARSAGDQLSLEQLKAEVAGQDLDAVKAATADLGAEAARLDEAIESAISERQAAQVALERHEQPSGVARAVVERESATAEMHRVLERYVELKVARELVDKAVQRVRAEQQDPLIKEAGKLFARMTRGKYSAVAADVDDKGQPVVVGVRAGGGQQTVATMSDGTRDQLFLAFRLASLAAYSAATEPLPFIADDILVHFDDNRALATLELLADFDQTNQVLLFTHHLSIRDAVEPLVREGRANVVTLDSLG